MNASRHALAAYVTPFAIFMLGLVLVSAVQAVAGPTSALPWSQPAYWVYPLQSLACAAALIYFWKAYDFGPTRPVALAVATGGVVFLLWISPQALFGQPARAEGFDPEVFAADPALYWGTVLARFFRLVVIVPLIEEIFWRGFLQRYLVNERFATVAFGTYTPLSFWGVVVAFTLVHNQADWPAAFVTGALFGWLAVRTKSLLACVGAHAVANLALGGYIMFTRQWGFW